MAPWLQIAGLAVARVLVSLVLLAGLGSILVHCARRLRGSACPREPFAQAFTFLSVGIAVFVAAFAVVTTGGRTVLWCVFAALFGLFAFRDTEAPPEAAPAPPDPRAHRALVAGACAFVVLGIWAGLHLFRAGPFPYQLSPGGDSDTAYWAAAARALPSTGIESGAGFEAVLDPGAFGPEPYHYVELWLTSAIAKGWSVATYDVILFDAPVILGVIWFFGLLAVAEALGASLWRTVVVGLVVIAFAPYVPLSPNAVPWLSGWDVLMSEGAILGRVSAGRLLPGYIVVAAAALLAVRERPRRALAILGLAPAMNPTLLALPVGGIVAFLLLARGEYAAPRRFLRVVLPCSAILVAFWSFYAVYSRMLPPDLLPDLLDPRLLRTKINIVGKSTLQTLLVYSPYLGLAWASGAQVVRRGLTVGVAVAGVGLLGWVATHPFLDSSQFFVNATVVILNSAFVLGLIVPHGGQTQRLLVGLAALVAVIRWGDAVRHPQQALAYSTEYLEDVHRAGSGLAGGFVVPREVLTSHNAHALYLRTNMVPYLEPVASARGVVAIVDVVPFVPWEAMRYRYEDLLFRRFLGRYGVPREPHVAACMQEAFVDHYGLDFVILVGNAAEPEWLRAREVRRLADRISGDRFVLIDKERHGRRPEECPYAMTRDGGRASADLF